MRCQDAVTQFVAQLTGALSEPDRRELENHLGTCPQCQADAERQDDMWRRLASISSVQPDSAAMRQRFNALMAESVREISPGAALARTRSSPAPRSKDLDSPYALGRIRGWLSLRMSFHPALQACAAVLLLVCGFQIGRDIRPSGSPEVAALGQQVRSLQQMVALSLMQQDSASARLKGVSWSGRLDQPDDSVVASLVDALMHDDNVLVRLASIDALKRFADRGAVRSATVRELSTQSAPLVQMALIDFVVETQNRKAVATLKRLSQDATVDASVRNRASWGLGHLEAV